MTDHDQTDIIIPVGKPDADGDVFTRQALRDLMSQFDEGVKMAPGSLPFVIIPDNSFATPGSYAMGGMIERNEPLYHTRWQRVLVSLCKVLPVVPIGDVLRHPLASPIARGPTPGMKITRFTPTEVSFIPKRDDPE